MSSIYYTNAKTSGDSRKKVRRAVSLRAFLFAFAKIKGQGIKWIVLCALARTREKKTRESRDVFLYTMLEEQLFKNILSSITYNESSRLDRETEEELFE